MSSPSSSWSLLSSRSSNRKRKRSTTEQGQGQTKAAATSVGARTKKKEDGSYQDHRKMPAVNKKVVHISDTVKNPTVGMRLEVLDADYIWSPARIIKVTTTSTSISTRRKGRMTTKVVIRYEGWPSSYDETISWENDKNNNRNRLAPLYSFTKRVKCLAEILSSKTTPPTKKKTYNTSNLWPCMVVFRMPHPVVNEGMVSEPDYDDDDKERCLDAQQFLREEPNVFVQPYCPSLLPKHVRNALSSTTSSYDGGKWINVRDLRMWPTVNTDRCPSSKLRQYGILHPNFDRAFHVAQNDTTTVGVLPAGAVEKKSLLKSAFRVHSRAGATIRDGALREEEEEEEEQESVQRTSSRRLMEEATKEESATKQRAAVEVVQFPQQDEEDTEQTIPRAAFNNEEMDDVQTIETIEAPPPPSLPPPIEITEPIYDSRGVKWCKTSRQWMASVCLGGNQVFLGKFPTQTQAYQAIRIAAGEDIQIETDLRKAQLADLLAVPIEMIMDAKDEQYVPSDYDFSIHEYALKLMRHEASVVNQADNSKEGRSFPNNQTALFGSSESSAVTPPSSRKNKRKGIPRKVDLEKQCFVDEQG